jgi:hypothetical protein
MKLVSDIFFKSIAHEYLFMCAYAPISLAKFYLSSYEEAFADSLSDEACACKRICRDCSNDEKYGTHPDQRLERHPRIKERECFKSEEYRKAFYLIYLSNFAEITPHSPEPDAHNCGDVKVDILGLTENVEDIPEKAEAWVKEAQDLVNSLSDISKEERAMALYNIEELSSFMNLR